MVSVKLKLTSTKLKYLQQIQNINVFSIKYVFGIPFALKNYI